MCSEEKKILLNKIDKQISEKKEGILRKLPSIHTVDDGIILRFFTSWDNCDDNERIKYKKITHKENSNDITYFFYLPKGAYFHLKERNFIKSVTCLNGKLEIDFPDKFVVLEANEKMDVQNHLFEGIAIENTYLITNG